MIKPSLALLVFCAMLSGSQANAQVASIDMGLLSLGGHSTQPRHVPFASVFAIMQTYSEYLREAEVSYLATELSYTRSWSDLSMRIGANFQSSSTSEYNGAGPDYRRLIMLDRQQSASPRILNEPLYGASTIRLSNTSFGDASVRLSYFFGPNARFGVHGEFQQPLTVLRRERSMRLQSSLGVPKVMIGASFENTMGRMPAAGISPNDASVRGFKARYGATIAYGASLGMNSLGLDRSDDVSLSLLAQTMHSPLRFGVDLSGIYHITHDRADTNSQWMNNGFQSEGYTVNAGASLTYDASYASYNSDEPGLAVSLFASAPIAETNDRGYLWRTWTTGLRISYGVR